VELHREPTQHRSVLRLGTRGSKLALAQSQWVADRLHERCPNVDVQFITVRTQGDILQNVSLSQIGGTGVFVKEIEAALLAEAIDLAVHSLKDLPLLQPPGLIIGAVCQREDPRDVLLTSGPDGLDALPRNAVVGAGSLRRKAQLLAYRPDLTVRDIRGNVDTRLRKLQQGDYDAVVLAAAGLKRLGYLIRESQYLPLDVMLPAVGQGALAVEVREKDEFTAQCAMQINDPQAEAATRAEKAFLAAFGGGCAAPVGAYAKVHNSQITLWGMVADLNGQRLLRDEVSGLLGEPHEVGQELARKLFARGAGEFVSR